MLSPDLSLPVLPADQLQADLADHLPGLTPYHGEREPVALGAQAGRVGDFKRIKPGEHPWIGYLAGSSEMTLVSRMITDQTPPHAAVHRCGREAPDHLATKLRQDSDLNVSGLSFAPPFR